MPIIMLAQELEDEANVEVVCGCVLIHPKSLDDIGILEVAIVLNYEMLLKKKSVDLMVLFYLI